MALHEKEKRTMYLKNNQERISLLMEESVFSGKYPAQKHKGNSVLQLVLTRSNCNLHIIFASPFLRFSTVALCKCQTMANFETKNVLFSHFRVFLGGSGGEGEMGEVGNCILPTVVRYAMRGKGREEYTK